MTPADTTYDVRVWKTQVNARRSGKTYTVRWRVAARRWKETFKTAALADSFRAGQLAASRKGEAFDLETGRPVAMVRSSKGHMSWHAFACAFADMKWPRVAATTRRIHAEALTAITVLMFTNDRGKPGGKLLRSALTRWAFNTARRDDPNCPDEIRGVLRWAADHTRPVSALRDPKVLRRVLDGLTVKLDGSPAAPCVASRHRKILHAALEYAVELELLDELEVHGAHDFRHTVLDLAGGRRHPNPRGRPAHWCTIASAAAGGRAAVRSARSTGTPPRRWPPGWSPRSRNGLRSCSRPPPRPASKSAKQAPHS